MSSFERFLPLLAVAAIAAVTLYVSRLRRPLKAFEITLLILLLSIPLLMLGVYHLGTYGWGMFVVMPFLTGFVSALLYCRNVPARTWRECRNIALGTTLAAGVGVLAAGL